MLRFAAATSSPLTPMTRHAITTREAPTGLTAAEEITTSAPRPPCARNSEPHRSALSEVLVDAAEHKNSLPGCRFPGEKTIAPRTPCNRCQRHSSRHRGVSRPDQWSRQNFRGRLPAPAENFPAIDQWRPSPCFRQSGGLHRRGNSAEL